MDIINVKDILSKAFTTTKKGEDTITIFDDNMPTELKDLFFKNDFEIDNFYYDNSDYAFDLMNDAITDAKSINEAIKIIEDFDSITDELEADPYTSQLTNWLNSNNINVDYITQALQEFGEFKNGFDLLAMAQYIAKCEVYNLAKDVFLKYLTNNK